MAVLNWKHHTLLQALMSRGPLQENEFHKIFAAVTGRNPRSHELDFNDFLLKINKELSYVQMELRRCRNQSDGQVCYGLVNNVSDEQSKLGTKYSVPQIALYKGIVHSGTGSQSQGGSSQVPPALRNFSMSQKEKTLDELVHDRWLCLTPDGDIGLGVKSYIDLRSWFHNSGIPSCEVCNEAAIKAKVCQNEGCTLRIHHYCLKKKFSQSRGEIDCPTCGTQWECQIPKSEVVEIKDELNEPIESQPLARSNRRKLKTNRNADADTVGCGSGSSQGSSSVSDLRRVTRSLARTR
ncbi:uncharacterized protein LOC110645156 [Hevea brasiliensis]|uniref:uncharacterized protein LOC110645156 n=1 Tax=Hevea brasiliensis TaxID=3981 RepID=UPI0025F3F08A|nr:uncharacterized protein LOC110645156 [Hevea brasiliensis]